MSESSPPPSVRSLDRTFAHGVLWTALAKWGTQIITWTSVVLVARLLSPAEIGVVALAGVFNVPFRMLAEFGLGSAVVQMRDLPEEVIQQLQTAAMLIAGLFCVAGWFLIPLVASFFGVPDLRWILVVGFSSLLMVSYQTVPLSRLRRALDYRRLSLLEAMELSLTAFGTVIAAYLGASYWSSLWGIIGARLVITVVLIRMVPSPFRLPQWDAVKAPLLFGWRVSIANFTYFASAQVDSLILAKRLGEAPLGSYRLAWDFASGPAEKVSALLMRASGPLFAGLDKDLALIRRYFLRITEPLSLSVFPVLVGIALVAPDAVILVVGEKWRSAIGPLQALALGRTVGSLNALCTQVLTSLHQPRFLMYVGILKVALLAISCYFAAPFGVTAVAAVWLVIFPLEHLLYMGRLLQLTPLGVMEYLRVLLPALAGCTAMAAVVYGLQSLPIVTEQPVVVRLGAQVLGGAAAYMGLLATFWRPRLAAYLSFAKSLRKPAAA